MAFARSLRLAPRATTSCLRARSPSSRSIFTVVPGPVDRVVNAYYKEQRDRSKVDFTPSAYGAKWAGGNEGFQKLLDNKHYEHALDYFNVMLEHGPAPDVHTFNISFEVFEKIGNPWDVIETFNVMLQRGIAPNATSYAWVIKAYCLGDSLKAALAMLEQHKKVATPSSRTYAVVIDLCTRLKKFDIATALIDEVNKTKRVAMDIEYFNALVRFYSAQGQREKAIEVFGEVKDHPTIKLNYNTFQRVLDMQVAAGDVERAVQIIETMKSSGFVPNDNKTKYALFQIYSKTGDARLIECLENTYRRDVWERDGHVKYYREFINAYVASGDLQVNVKEALFSNDVDVLEDAYISIVGHKLDSLEWTPTFDRYGDVEQEIENIGTGRSDWMGSKQQQQQRQEQQQQHQSRGWGGAEEDEEDIDPNWPNFEGMNRDDALATYRSYVLKNPESAAKHFPPPQLEDEWEEMDAPDELTTAPHPQAGLQDAYERFKARLLAESAGETKQEAASKIEGAAYKDQGGYKDTDDKRAETRKSRRSEVAQAAKADAEATQYVAQMLKPNSSLNPLNQSSAAFARKKRGQTKVEIVTPHEEYDREVNARMERLKIDQPAVYQKLWRQYRADVYGERTLEDDDIDAVKADPMGTLMSQLRAVEELKDPIGSDEQDVMDTAFRSLNYQKGPDAKFRRMVAHYMAQKLGRALQDRQRRKRDF